MPSGIGVGRPQFSTSGEERILLRLGEAVDLVEEQHRGEAVEVAGRQRLLHDLAHVLDARGDRGESTNSAGAVGDRLRERRLARAGAPEDDRHRALLARLVGGEAHERRAGRRAGASGRRSRRGYAAACAPRAASRRARKPSCAIHHAAMLSGADTSLADDCSLELPARRPEDHRGIEQEQRARGA